MWYETGIQRIHVSVSLSYHRTAAKTNFIDDKVDIRDDYLGRSDSGNCFISRHM